MLPKALFALHCALFVSPAVAQTTVQDYRYADLTQLWRNTQNAAGLTLDSTQNRGLVSLDLLHHEGDYRRVQEGGQQNALGFFTERYQTVGRFLHAYGRFNFNMDRTKDRAWCDVMRPYFSNPFFPGSSIAGKYDTQSFDFTAALSTIQMWGTTLGVRLDYLTADQSRLRDPRSRTQLLDYRLMPSLTYNSGQQTYGLAAGYHRRKEKLPSLTTVQQDPNLVYYLMTGLEQATGTVGGYSSFNREWVDHRLNVELSFAQRTATLHSLTTLSYDGGTENAYGTYKQEPGRYVSRHYAVQSQNRLRHGSILHQLDLKANLARAYADEYRQQLVQERDADHGYTSYRYETLINFQKRHQQQLASADLRYRASTVVDGSTIGTPSPTLSGYIGLSAHYDYAHQKHLLHTSELTVGALDLNLEGGHALLSQRLWLDAVAGYHFSTKTALSLADATTDYAQQVLLPDMRYYEADYWRARLQLTYQFPLSIKGSRNTWFVRAYGDYLKSNNHLSASTVGLSVGLFN